MLRMFNFKCESSSEVYEKLVNDEKTIIICKCGSKANKAISAGRYLGNTTGKYPRIN
jgi:hypothetical protein